MKDNEMSDSELVPKPADLPPARRPPFMAIGGGLIAAGAGAFLLGADSLIAIPLLAGGAFAWLGAALTPKARASANAEESARAARLKERSRYIGKARYLTRVGKLGEHAADQLQQATHQFKSFDDVLALKFAPTELTFARYRGAAEQTYLAIVDNLSSVATILHSIDVIDPDAIDRRLAEIARHDNAEAQSLTERKALRAQEMARAVALLSFNEEAITEFSRLRAALAVIRTQKGEADVGLESAIAELALLASRAQHYALEHKGDTDNGNRSER